MYRRHSSLSPERRLEAQCSVLKFFEARVLKNHSSCIVRNSDFFFLSKLKKKTFFNKFNLRNSFTCTVRLITSDTLGSSISTSLKSLASITPLRTAPKSYSDSFSQHNLYSHIHWLAVSKNSSIHNLRHGVSLLGNCFTSGGPLPGTLSSVSIPQVDNSVKSTVLSKRVHKHPVTSKRMGTSPGSATVRKSKSRHGESFTYNWQLSRKKLF